MREDMFGPDWENYCKMIKATDILGHVFLVCSGKLFHESFCVFAFTLRLFENNLNKSFIPVRIKDIFSTTHTGSGKTAVR